MMHTQRFTPIAITLLLLTAATAWPAAGDLDSTFDSDGKVTTDISTNDDYANAVAIQSDGKIVAAGPAHNGTNYDFALARYKPDGTLDSTFGSGGIVATDFSAEDDWAYADDDWAYAVAIQPDGKIVAAGFARNRSNDAFALARYNPNGTLDSTFGSDGKVTTDFGAGSDSAEAVAIQPDGKIVAAGRAYNGSNSAFALARYNSDGTLDSTFGSGGKVTTDFGPNDDWATAVAIQPDGKIIAAGFARNRSNDDFALARYNSNGTLDSTFGSDGKVTTPFGASDDSAEAVVIQSDGKIVAVGRVYNGSNYDFALARYNSNGTLDSTFGSGGKVTTDFRGSADFAEAVAIQSDGKIIAAGYASSDSNNDFALARYNPNGTPDSTFGSGGKVTTPFGAGSDSVEAVAIQPDGKIVAAGYARTASKDFALARYVLR